SGAVETIRSARGVDVNDPDPETAPFSHNLAAADAEPYPNLADVPPPPTRASTAAERQKLAQSLVADRTATAARAGLPASAPPAAAVGAPLRAPAPGPAQPQQVA